MAVISQAGVVYSRSVHLAGNQMNDAIMNYMRRTYNMLVGERTAEMIKIQVGSAYPLEQSLAMEVKGRNLIEGVPKTVILSDGEVRQALSEGIMMIVNQIRIVLERMPSEFSADIRNRGIVLTGGGALIRNLDKRIQKECGIPTRYAENPLASAVLGTASLLTQLPLLRRIAEVHPTRAT
jgi:rod shape-determining protein MreB